MKMITIITALLLVLGCSSNWSTNPAGQEYETNVSLQLLDDGSWVTPVSDVEPQDPECATHVFGYVQMENPCNSPVSCRIDQEIPCLIPAGGEFTMQASQGYHTLYWYGVSGIYEQSVYVPRCKTAEVAFEQNLARKLNVYQ